MALAGLVIVNASFIGEDTGEWVLVIDRLFVVILPLLVGLLDLGLLLFQLLEVVLAVQLVVDQLDLVVGEGHRVELRPI